VGLEVTTTKSRFDPLPTQNAVGETTDKTGTSDPVTVWSSAAVSADGSPDRERTSVPSLVTTVADAPDVADEDVAVLLLLVTRNQISAPTAIRTMIATSAPPPPPRRG
jgi:hypothetical protein